MMRSLYAGVSGLKTHQTKMDVIGNNIANVNTVAYKSSSITFSELMYQTTQKASGPNGTTGTAGTNAKQIGLGVTSGAISNSITTAGATQTTGNPFDLKITGDAFFIVSNGGDTLFTRDGSFYVDAAGNLAMSSTGYNVMGWQADDATQTIKADTVTPLRILSPANLTYPPEATTQAYISGIVDKNDTNVNSTSGKIMNLGFYDELGYSYTAKLSIHATTEPGEYYVVLDDIQNAEGASIKEEYEAADISEIVKMGNPFAANVSESYFLISSADKLSAADSFTIKANIDGVDYQISTKATGSDVAIAISNDTTNNLVSIESQTAEATPTKTLTFEAADLDKSAGTAPDTVTVRDALSKLYNIDLEGVQNLSIDMETGEMTVTNRNVAGCKLIYDVTTGKFRSVDGADACTIDFNNYVGGGTTGRTLGNFKDITVDFSKSTMFDNNGTSTVSATNGTDKGLGTGRKLGDMTGVSISNNGMIYATYDNGQTKLLGQIAVTEFSNAAGLEKKGDNLYEATQNSGDFDGIGIDISSNGGYMNTGVLEMSNVDLSSEFTEMITTQRGFQANSRIITTSDTLLEELVNLKR